jgi:hypothetical protein
LGIFGCLVVFFLLDLTTFACAAWPLGSTPIILVIIIVSTCIIYILNSQQSHAQFILHDNYSIDFGIEVVPTSSFARHYSYKIANENKTQDNKKINKPKEKQKLFTPLHNDLVCMELEESSILNMGLQWKNKVKKILESLLTLEHELQNEITFRKI